jgi:hypothetical protein
MAEPTGERLAALEATLKEFKDAFSKGLDQRFADLKNTLDGQFKRLDDRFKSVDAVISSLDKLIWRAILGGIGAIVSLWIGIGVLYQELGGLDKKVATVETKLDGVSDAIKSVPNAVAELKTISSTIQSNAQTLQGATGTLRDAAGALASAIKSIPNPAPSQSESPGTLNILVFDEKQKALIRTLPKEFGAVVTSLADKLNLGDVATDPELLKSFVKLPAGVFKEVPQLDGTKFVVGQTRIVIARSTDDRVVGVVAL